MHQAYSAFQQVKSATIASPNTCKPPKFLISLCPRFKPGEMSEWFKEHAWKVCIPPKGIQGSNPCLSAVTK
jgi:hypothetical protein